MPNRLSKITADFTRSELELTTNFIQEKTYIDMADRRFKIDREKSFDTLPQAPIIEAVVEIRCLSEEPWLEETIPNEIAKRLTGYLLLDSKSEYKQSVQIRDSVPIADSVEKLGWHGVRYRSDDEKYVSAFNRDCFNFSRVGPYDTWPIFRDEAMRGWEVHNVLAKPIDIQRIGLRFINRIPLPGIEVDLGEFIYPGPQPPKGLSFPIVNFLHRDSFRVPDNPYQINVIRTVSSTQPAQGDVAHAIILDIDVYHQENCVADDIIEHLENMRVLKNEVFWGSVHPTLLDKLRGDS